MKYSKEKVAEIEELLSSGDYIVRDICKMVGISEATYYNWKNEEVEFLEAIKRAENKRLESFKNMARSGLAKLLDVFEYEEVTTEYVNPKDRKGMFGNAKADDKPVIVAQKRVKKRVMPNPTAVIFALTNMDNQNFKHKQEIDHSNKGDKFENTTIDVTQLADMINNLNKD